MVIHHLPKEYLQYTLDLKNLIKIKDTNAELTTLIEYMIHGRYGQTCFINIIAYR